MINLFLDESTLESCLTEAGAYEPIVVIDVSEPKYIQFFQTLVKRDNGEYPILYIINTTNYRIDMTIDGQRFGKHTYPNNYEYVGHTVKHYSDFPGISVLYVAKVGQNPWKYSW